MPGASYSVTIPLDLAREFEEYVENNEETRSDVLRAGLRRELQQRQTN